MNFYYIYSSHQLLNKANKNQNISDCGIYI